MTVYTTVIQELNTESGVFKEPLVYAEFSEKALLLKIIRDYINAKVEEDNSLFEAVYQYLPEEVSEATVDDLDNAVQAFLDLRPFVFIKCNTHEAEIKLPALTWTEKSDDLGSLGYVDQGCLQYVEPREDLTRLLYIDDDTAYDVAVEMRDDALSVVLTQGTAEKDVHYDVRFGDLAGVASLHSSGELSFTIEK